MGTIYDLAKKTGFSITTVSKALNNYKDVSEKTRTKILQAAAEMDYLPNAHAQSLSTKKSWAIGVMFSEANEVGIKHPFFNGIIESFRHATEEHGYDLIFASRNLRNRDMSYLEHFKHRAVDGIVVICSDRMDEQVQELMQSDIPIVVVDMDSANCSVVYSDNSEGARMAVNYLYELGHRAIAHIAGDSSIDAGAARVKGYELAMHALDLPIQPGYLVNAGFFSVEEGKQAMEQLLQLPSPPTAVFVAGDQMAIGAIRWFSQGANPEAWVNDKNELVLTEDKINYMDYAKELREKQYTALAPEWSPSWFEGMSKPIKVKEDGKEVETQVFSYVLLTWGLHSVLKDSAKWYAGVIADQKAKHADSVEA